MLTDRYRQISGKPVETAPVAEANLGAVWWGLKEMGRLDEIHLGLKSKMLGFRTTLVLRDQ